MCRIAQLYNTSTYKAEEKDFWSSTEQLGPSCVFLPDTTDEVAQAVKLFVENECSFSIKGGGRSTIPGAANIHDRILMSMKNLKRFEINDDKTSVIAGAGNNMGDIYAGLDPHNLTAMVGRYQRVGLGMALGGGINFLVNKNGLAIDNIINYEVVLADAIVVNANATNHPDLFRALKGGNNNFGVVTAFTFRTEPTEGSIYGGILYYAESSFDQVADIIYDYQIRQAAGDTLTHALPQYGYNASTNEAISFNPVVYSQGLDIPAYKSTLRNRQYCNLSVELDNSEFPSGLVEVQRVFTAYANAQLYKDFWAHFHAWCQNFQHISGFYYLHVNMPITPCAVQEGIKNGGDSLGLENIGNRVVAVIYFGVSFDSLNDIDEVLPAHKEFVESMIALTEKRNLLHRLIMLPYSAYDQAAIESHGPENVQKMLAVQKVYDPHSVFQRLVPGGQKLPTDMLWLHTWVLKFRISYVGK
ncbi:hypothetical protein GGS24DRAFT_492742 [Hypoxylon argillaceum]|nr:hypothetical protein GGS24DRAFT_492742 [Hypoxylon argillaceum]